MQFSRPHMLFTIHGTLGAPPDEQWSCSLRGTNDEDAPPANMQAMVDAMFPPTYSFFANYCSTPQAMTHVKLAWIGLDGLYPPGMNAVEHILTPAGDFGGAPTAGAHQTALAVSLGTDASRGIATKGRFYMPRTKVQIDIDGRHPATAILNMANSCKTWLNELKALEFAPGIFSQGTVAHPAPYHNFVTNIRIGRVPDTIRSRRRNLVEDYQTAVL